MAFSGVIWKFLTIQSTETWSGFLSEALELYLEVVGTVLRALFHIYDLLCRSDKARVSRSVLARQFVKRCQIQEHEQEPEKSSDEEGAENLNDSGIVSKQRIAPPKPSTWAQVLDLF